MPGGGDDLDRAEEARRKLRAEFRAASLVRFVVPPFDREFVRLLRPGPDPGPETEPYDLADVAYWKPIRLERKGGGGPGWHPLDRDYFRLRDGRWIVCRNLPVTTDFVVQEIEESEVLQDPAMQGYKPPPSSLPPPPPPPSSPPPLPPPADLDLLEAMLRLIPRGHKMRTLAKYLGSRPDRTATLEEIIRHLYRGKRASTAPPTPPEIDKVQHVIGRLRDRLATQSSPWRLDFGENSGKISLISHPASPGAPTP